VFTRLLELIQFSPDVPEVGLRKIEYDHMTVRIDSDDPSIAALVAERIGRHAQIRIPWDGCEHNTRRVGIADVGSDGLLYAVNLL
jgi:hypothetical protein